MLKSRNTIALGKPQYIIIVNAVESRTSKQIRPLNTLTGVNERCFFTSLAIRALLTSIRTKIWLEKLPVKELNCLTPKNIYYNKIVQETSKLPTIGVCVRVLKVQVLRNQTLTCSANYELAIMNKKPYIHPAEWESRRHLEKY